MTIEIIRNTGETEEKEIITKDEKGIDVKQTIEVPVKELANTYECEGEGEDTLLQRARLTAEIWTRDKEGEFTARIQS